MQPGPECVPWLGGCLRVAPLMLMVLVASASSSRAVEGTTAAGPLGGTDIRAAHSPPPGFYGGLIFLAGDAPKLVDGKGRDIPALSAAHFTLKGAAPFALYVPDVRVFGGLIAIAGVLPYGAECGRLFAAQPWSCAWGAGDPYVEVGWSRYFGTPRASRVPNSFPIPEGLAVSVGLGAVFPAGQYKVQQATRQGIGVGDNTFDLAPSIAVTYTSPPIFAEATELSAKLYWNNYRTNSATQYHAADLISIDFAVTERYGPFQIGVTGFYGFQTGGDTHLGVKVPPDGRRVDLLALGAILAHDLPEFRMSMKIKAVTNVWAENAVRSQTIVIGFVRKFD